MSHLCWRESIKLNSIFFIFRATPKELKSACKWLLEHKLDDGGWGELFESCEQKIYVPSETSITVNTAWALLALMSVRYV